MDQYIVTGASGFVGSNLANHFKKHKLGEVVKLNLRNAFPSELPDAKAIIHLAGKAHDLKNISNPQEYFYVNTQLTEQLFELFLQSKCRDFIYFSSVKAAADRVTGVLTEEHTADPKTPYGQSKLRAEAYILSKSLPKDKRIFILRPCMIHGPGNKGNLNLLYQVVKKGIPYPLAAFENSRSFLSISNLLYIIEKILNNPAVPGGIYNLADDQPLPTTEVIKVMGKAIETKTRLWRLSPGIVRTVAKIGDSLHLPLNSERLKKLTESYVVSNAKIMAALKINTLPVSSSEGLLNTIKSFE